MQTETLIPDGILQKIEALLNERPRLWKNTTSKTCFMFSGRENALTICDYLDSESINNISICTIDNLGSIDEMLIINSHEQEIEYRKFKTLYLKIKDQVQKNIFTSLQSELERI